MYGYIHNRSPDAQQNKTGIGRYFDALRAGLNGRQDVEFFGLDVPKAAEKKKNFLEYHQWAKFGFKNCATGCLDLIPLLDDEFRDMREFFRGHYDGIRNAERIFAPSQWVKNTMLDMLDIKESKIQVVPLGFSREVFYPMGLSNFERMAWLEKQGVRAAGPVFGHVSAAYPRKNIGRIIQALRHFPDAVFVKVGKEEDSDYSTQRAARDWGISERVFILPGLSETDLRWFYNSIDVFVFPSLMEGFGLPPLEAHACGCRVVGSGTTALDEVLAPHDIRVSPESVDSIAEGMARAVNLPRPQIDRPHLDKFNWRNTSDAVSAWLG